MKYSIYKFLLAAMLCSFMFFITACSQKENAKEIVNREDMESTVDFTEQDSTLAETAEESSAQETEVSNTVTPEESKLYWKFDTEGKVISTPVVSGEMIYFGSNDGNLYAVNKDTGLEVWRYTLEFPILCEPAVQDDIVFFSGKDIFVAVDAKTGTEIWLNNEQEKSDEIRRKDQWDYHDPTPVIDNGVVYFGSFAGYIFGYDMNSGEKVWEFDASSGNPVRTTPIILNGIIYYGDWKGCYRAVNIEKKKVVWENEFVSPFQSAAVIQDDVLFVGGRDTRISAIDCNTGEIKWELKDSFGSWITGDPVVYGDNVYFATSDAKKVYALNMKDGSVTAEYPIYKNSFTKVIIDNGLLYVTSGDAYDSPGTGKLQVYSLEDSSKPVEEYTLKTGGIFTSPVLDGNVIYFGSVDNSMYAVKLDCLQ